MAKSINSLSEAVNRESMTNQTSTGRLVSSRDLPLFLKWAGGKSQLIEQFRSLFPKKVEHYYEPFIGSGAVFFFVKMNLNPKSVMISDINEDLLNCFTIVRDNVSALIKSLVVHKNNHSKEYYYSVRNLDTSHLNNTEKASRLIYMNKTCFNGLYRVNSKSMFNVPFGDYKNPGIFSEHSLYHASQLLQDVEIKVMAFDRVLDFAKGADFIYLDPPYVPLSKTSNFTGYAKGEFGIQMQRRLAEVFKALDSRGCYVMLSNSDHPLVRVLYKEYERNIRIVRARRMINSVASKRGAINEIVVRNYDNYDLERYL